MYLTVEFDAFRELKEEPIFLSIVYDEKGIELKAYLECLIVMQGFPVVLRCPVMHSRRLDEETFLEEAKKRAKELLGYEPMLGYFKLMNRGEST